jgi:hypothetical protein
MEEVGKTNHPKTKHDTQAAFCRAEKLQRKINCTIAARSD